MDRRNLSKEEKNNSSESIIIKIKKRTKRIFNAELKIRIILECYQR